MAPEPIQNLAGDVVGFDDDLTLPTNERVSVPADSLGDLLDECEKLASQLRDAADAADNTRARAMLNIRRRRLQHAMAAVRDHTHALVPGPQGQW